MINDIVSEAQQMIDAIDAARSATGDPAFGARARRVAQCAIDLATKPRHSERPSINITINVSGPSDPDAIRGTLMRAFASAALDLEREDSPVREYGPADRAPPVPPAQEGPPPCFVPLHPTQAPAEGESPAAPPPHAAAPPSSVAPPGQISIEGSGDTYKLASDPATHVGPAPKRAEETAVPIESWEPDQEWIASLPWASEWVTASLPSFREAHKGQSAKRPATVLRRWLSKHEGAAANVKPAQ